jgi:predicted short-subunit dehydrogenase-like oxidoreductase (DUF2520 family)
MPAMSKRSRVKSAAAGSARRNNRRLRISIIGAGRLGTVLGRALRQAGHHLDIVVTTRLATARRAAKAIASESLATTPAQLRDRKSRAYRRFAESDLIIIATPDSAIESVANGLAAAIANSGATRVNKDRTVLHTSGATSSEVLKALRDAGLATGSFHPLVSVADRKSNPEVFRGVHFCVEGDARAVRVARMLVIQIGGRSFTIRPQSKPLYHAAAVMASGHTVALFDLALTMLSQCGLSARETQRILLPLLRSTARNLEKETPARALTGPYARGDFETARKHLTALQASDLNEAAEVYKILARHSVGLGKNLKRGPDSERLARLLHSKT